MIHVGLFQLSKFSDSGKFITQLGLIQACGSASTPAPRCVTWSASEQWEEKTPGQKEQKENSQTQPLNKLPCSYLAR